MILSIQSMEKEIAEKAKELIQKKGYSFNYKEDSIQFKNAELLIEGHDLKEDDPILVHINVYSFSVSVRWKRSKGMAFYIGQLLDEGVNVYLHTYKGNFEINKEWLVDFIKKEYEMTLEAFLDSYTYNDGERIKDIYMNH